MLNQYDIPIAVDLPGVGDNLQDHCLVGTFYPCKSLVAVLPVQFSHALTDNNASFPSPTELTTNATYDDDALAEYNAHKTGT